MTGSRPTLALNEHKLLFLTFSSHLELPNHQNLLYITSIQVHGVFRGELNAILLKIVKEFTMVMGWAISGGPVTSIIGMYLNLQHLSPLMNLSIIN